mmetsp:Transcript_152582/g.489303  ORF Transcript_152582/g.489303 Transcript_152582/m.489303 type:complete len:305 (-) Transcript_152582:749-1663(-)
MIWGRIARSSKTGSGDLCTSGIHVLGAATDASASRGSEGRHRVKLLRLPWLRSQIACRSIIIEAYNVLRCHRSRASLQIRELPSQLGEVVMHSLLPLLRVSPLLRTALLQARFQQLPSRLLCDREIPELTALLLVQRPVLRQGFAQASVEFVPRQPLDCLDIDGVALLLHRAYFLGPLLPQLPRQPPTCLLHRRVRQRGKALHLLLLMLLLLLLLQLLLPPPILLQALPGLLLMLQLLLLWQLQLQLQLMLSLLLCLQELLGLLLLLHLFLMQHLQVLLSLLLRLGWLGCRIAPHQRLETVVQL